MRALIDRSIGDVTTVLVTADVRGEGTLDLVIASQTANTVSWLAGNGNGTFQAHVGLVPSWPPGIVAAVDVSGDGNQRIAGTVTVSRATRLP